MMLRPLSSWRLRVGLALFAIAAAASAPGADGSAAPAEPRHFQITPQPLASALLACAEQAGIQIVFRNEALGNRWSSGIDGWYSSAQAVDALLRDTGLHYEFSGKNTLVIPAIVSPGNESPRTGKKAPLKSTSQGE